MPQRYYIDACIWRDLHENRVDKFRPLGEWAFEMFKMIKETKSKALYSELVLKELSITYSEEKIREMFMIIEENNLLEKVEIKREQIQEVLRFKKKEMSLSMTFFMLYWLEIIRLLWLLETSTLKNLRILL